MSNIHSFALALVVAGCSHAASEPLGPGSFLPVADADIRLVNATSGPLAFFAVAADLAPLLDPIPEVSIPHPSIHVVPAGGESELGEVPGRAESPEGGVAVYLYALSADGRTARFAEVHLASGAEIRRARGRIIIRRFPGTDVSP